MRQRISPKIWIPIVLFLVYVPMSSFLDLQIATFFANVQHKFHPPSWTWTVYRYGLIPGQLLFVVSFCTLCVGIFFWRKSPVTKASLYLSLTLVIGSGGVGHAMLKQFWPRPRPKQSILFGGKYPYLPLWKPYTGNKDRNLRSLPSGHATMGFYFFALYFVGKRYQKRWLACTGMLVAILLGGLLGWIRMAQGGHYFSDIVVSCLIMWLSAAVLDTFFANRNEHVSHT